MTFQQDLITSGSKRDEKPEEKITYNSAYGDEDIDINNDMIIIEEVHMEAKKSSNSKDRSHEKKSPQGILRNRSTSASKKKLDQTIVSTIQNPSRFSKPPSENKEYFIGKLKSYIWTHLSRRLKNRKQPEDMNKRVEDLLQTIDESFSLRDFKRWSVSALRRDPTTCEKKVRERFYRACDIYERVCTHNKPQDPISHLIVGIIEKMSEVVWINFSTFLSR